MNTLIEIINKFIEFISPRMLESILVVSGAGVIFLVIALLGILKEKQVLEKNFPSHLGRPKKTDLEKMINEAEKEEQNHRRVLLFNFRFSPVNHLKLRVRALLEATNFDKETLKKATPVLPKLEDLHELTLRNEQSRSSTTMMTTIVSFLLIMGILGTLTGVHGTLKDGIINQVALGGALKPSMWAVIGTILLMIGKGYYLREVDLYVARLDALTISHLLPALQDNQTQKNEQMKDFADKVGKQVQQIRQIHQLIEKNDVTDMCEKHIAGISQSITKAQETLQKLDERLQDLAEQQQRTHTSKEAEK